MEKVLEIDLSKLILEAVIVDELNDIRLENEPRLSEESACTFAIPLVVATIIGC